MDIKSLTEGVGVLDAGVEVLLEATKARKPALTIQGIAQPIPGWIEDTRCLLLRSGVDARQAESLEAALVSLRELTGSLLEKLGGGADAWSLYVTADVMHLTTQEMLADLSGED